ncbi:DNA topoisomerase IB [Ulvibacterium marinum]|uniref:DNA topoisomerase n=1 Tax=Ulvibacterium marinum TaxID=2419782 RepID=A0A3B0C2I0_9FLAO|nr:DNA topoisomerase IB [Ulvibacterium marinum]
MRNLKHETIAQLLQQPETAIELLDLIYVSDEHLSINRLLNESKFEYLTEDGVYLEQEDQLERIKSLVIPPAWQDVKITHLPNGHLQAVGKDAKSRKQYRYHPMWTKIRNQTKFYKMAAFGKVLPKIRKKVERDLNQDGWPKSKVLALIVKLMEETHIRIGSEQYARRNKTYGLSTLRTRHVNIHKDRLKFEFVGKKGKKHKISIRNKKLLHLVSKCEEIPGWELFQYYDKDGEKHSVDSGMVNSYIHNISGELFSAKDFRTWAASVVFFDTLLDLDPTEDEKQIHKNTLIGFDAAAEALGNTRNVCRKSYVHPLVVKKYEEGSLSEQFMQVERIEKEKPFMSPSEEVLLQLYGTYKPLEI